MYQWRKLSPTDRKAVLEERQANKRPWHSPPHYNNDSTNHYLFTSACYNHSPYIGHSNERLSQFEERIINLTETFCDSLIAWVILPNHYHFLAQTENALQTLSELGKLHGRTSFEWNGEENMRGRQVWHNATETAMKSDRHYQATINYVHHNPVKHGYAECWQDWPWSSAAAYLEKVGREKAEMAWKEYTIESYGKGWDD